MHVEKNLIPNGFCVFEMFSLVMFAEREIETERMSSKEKAYIARK